MMASRFQAVPLVAAPSYPNAIAWSDENLIAVASGHLITIINPALPFWPRGIITIHNADPLPIGVIERDQLHSGCLLPICLTRDCRPCVKMITWSPLGMSSHAGCLLAVCTTEGRVKLYRPPFCDFSAEWIEIMDISTKLYDYYASNNFRKFEEQESKDEGSDNLSKLDFGRKCKQRKTNAPSKNNKASRSSGRKASYRVGSKHDNNGFDFSDLVVQGLPTGRENNLNQIVSLIKSRENPLKPIEENSTLQKITSNEYATRMAMLSSLAVAWSPVLNCSQKVSFAHRNGSSVSILAVGGKCGKISLWKVSAPECFNIDDGTVHTTVVLIGLFQAHASWITNITCTFLDSASSKSNFILVTGSVDGSVKIWSAYCNELLTSSETSFTSFSLLKEMTSIDTAPVSTLAVAVPSQFPHSLLLTIGKGSGSFETLICDLLNGKYDKVGSFGVHDHVVTSLAWALDGRLLFCCSEDNFIRCWILDQNSFREVPISSNNLNLRIPSDLPDTFRSCFGVAVSPGNLLVAVVSIRSIKFFISINKKNYELLILGSSLLSYLYSLHFHVNKDHITINIRNFDIDSLDPMYEARIYKAAIEFYWIGGQRIDFPGNSFLEYHTESCPTLSEKELIYWESSILWSLKQYECLDRPLVLWDIIAALLTFRQSKSGYLECVLLKWLVNSFVGCRTDLSCSKILLHISGNLSKFSSRQLHLLNIICRRVVLAEMKRVPENQEFKKAEGKCFEEREISLWRELLVSTERELRQRLVVLSFSAFLNICSHPSTALPGNWHPNGLAEMLKWVALNDDYYLHDSLRGLATEAGIHQKRLQSGKDIPEDKCTCCSTLVPFESPEEAFCEGVVSQNGVIQRHRLERCAISMQVCPSTPLWFCICCQRWAFRLAPEALFTMSEYPSDFVPSRLHDYEVSSFPLCPFCGILLQRRQPDFLLSASPV